MPMVKGQKRLLLKVQSEISASQDFDRGRRSPYSTYLRGTPLSKALRVGRRYQIPILWWAKSIVLHTLRCPYCMLLIYQLFPY